MFVRDMKSIIKYVIELDIDYLETFLGYEGDNVLKVTTRSTEVTKLIEAYISNVGLEYKTEFDASDGTHIIFVGVEDPSVFKLKRD